MITQIRSKVDDDLLAVIMRPPFEVGARQNAGDDYEILQVAAISLPPGKTVKPHAHLMQSRNILGTQEAWVVVSGKILVTVYDTSEEKLSEYIVNAGDCFVLYRGGHGMQVIAPNTMIYEIKNGPYYGAERDTKPIN